MKKYIILFLLFTNFLYAQAPKIDLSFREEKAQQKEQQYRALAKVSAEVTANQKLYDVTYYDLDLAINFRDEIISGNVQIAGTITGDSSGSIELNFWHGLTISEIYLSNDPENQAAYTRTSDILKVDLDSTYSAGDKFIINVVYSGMPENNPYGYFKFDNVGGQPMIWTLNEPYGARGWFPCKDVPSDKADSVDIRIRVAENLIVASNGLLKEKIESGNSITYWWQSTYPIATYLISLAIYPYEQFSHWYIYGNNDSMEVQYYVFPGNYDNRVEDYAKTVDMIDYFASIFGEYPFVNEKYGHAEFLWGGGMEHQTLTSLGGASEMLIAHELAHQWWGDAVTCHSFHDLWLNEGFASYAEALWYEHEYPNWTASDYQEYSEYYGSGTIYIEDVDKENLFSKGLRYDKASWVLHMLRKVVGEDKFFEILRTFYTSQQFQYGTASTEEFILLCNEVSGMDLNKFFHQWLFEEYYPEYSYSWSSAKVDSGYMVNLNISQEQTNTGLFWMPIDVKISSLQKDYVFTVWDSLETQQFELFVKQMPRLMELDPDNWILKKVRQPDSNIVEEKYANNFSLFQNYPNPFNPETTIAFNLPINAEIEINIYNILGQYVATAEKGIYESGFHKIKYNSQNLSSGIYFYSLEYGNGKKMKKMVLMK